MVSDLGRESKWRGVRREKRNNPGVDGNTGPFSSMGYVVIPAFVVSVATSVCRWSVNLFFF